jgi:hypothetical protein
LILPEGSLNGAVVEGYHSVIEMNRGRILVAYTIEGRNGVLLGRISNSKRGFGSTLEIISLPKIIGTSSSDLIIEAPVLAHNKSSDMVYVAFYCNGKILLTYLSGITTGQTALNPLQLVAGNGDFTNNPMFSTLVTNHFLVNNQNGDSEEDVPPQRVGFLTSKDAGNLYVYYKDYNNEYKARRIYNTGEVSAPISI